MISGLESPNVNELILTADKDVKISGGNAPELKTGSVVVAEVLAEPLVCFEVVVDAAALDVVGLKLDDAFLGRKSL